MNHKGNIKTPNKSLDVNGVDEIGIELTDDELLEIVEENYETLAVMAYGEYQKKGRGAVCINFNRVYVKSTGLCLKPVYLADESEHLIMIGGWPDVKGGNTADLIKTYDPETTVAFLFIHKNAKVSAMLTEADVVEFTPKHLYESRNVERLH